jgi:tRNA (mo5U34)-methyltransferase
MDYSALSQQIGSGPLAALQPFLQKDFLSSLRHGDFPRWRRLISELPDIPTTSVELGEVIRIGREEDCDPQTRSLLESQLRQLIPWRKGPFNLYGIHIDSEWQSQLKWDRLKHHIKPLNGKTVLDVGSGNGYFSLRMHGAGAALTIGLDPHLPYVGQFGAIKHFIPQLPVHVLPLGLEQWPETKEAFDTVFSMGVLYHRRSPLDHLLDMKHCLKPGGELILESIVVDGNCGYSLIPEARYARMNNVWFVPSLATMERWLARCGFSNIKLVNESITDNIEQRKTNWMPFDSFTDSLDSDNPTLTIEGYPAPRRAIFIAENPAA